MKLAGTVSSVFHDYRVSRTRDGLFIEVLDYHAGPLTLTREDLARFGFVPTSGKRRGATADELEELTSRAIDLLEERIVYESRSSAAVADLRRQLLQARRSRRRPRRDPEPPAAS